jgi:uncharacterized glyoxalase superfamily protein PhnB
MAIPDQTEPPVLGTHRGFEVYPMPLFATLETADVDALARWYEMTLGFAAMFTLQDGGQTVLVHLRRRKYQDILVRRAGPGNAPADPGGWTLCLQAGEDVDPLAARAAAVPALGQACIGSPVDTPWNTREMRVVDPDGRQLVLSQPRFDPALTERMRRVFAADQEADP